MPTNPLLPLSTLDEWERQEQDWIQHQDPESRTASKILSLIADLRTLTAALDAVREERDTLLRFAGKALAEHENFCDWDGGDLQGALASCGLITPEPMAVPCCDDACVCAENALSGGVVECFRYTHLGRAAIGASHAAPQGDTPR